MSLITESVVSPKGQVNAKDLKEIGVNIIKFTMPALSVFFAQLALGVELKKAGLVALLALYGVLADFFKKLENGKK